MLRVIYNCLTSIQRVFINTKSDSLCFIFYTETRYCLVALKRSTNDVRCSLFNGAHYHTMYYIVEP